MFEVFCSGGDRLLLTTPVYVVCVCQLLFITSNSVQYCKSIKKDSSNYDILQNIYVDRKNNDNIDFLNFIMQLN